MSTDEKLEQHRVKVQNHDVNMEALVRARNQFHDALAAAYKTAKEIDSKVVLVLDSIKEAEQLIFIKEVRSVNHG